MENMQNYKLHLVRGQRIHFGYLYNLLSVKIRSALLLHPIEGLFSNHVLSWLLNHISNVWLMNFFDKGLTNAIH